MVMSLFLPEDAEHDIRNRSRWRENEPRGCSELLGGWRGATLRSSKEVDVRRDVERDFAREADAASRRGVVVAALVDEDGIRDVGAVVRDDVAVERFEDRVARPERLVVAVLQIAVHDGRRKARVVDGPRQLLVRAERFVRVDRLGQRLRHVAVLVEVVEDVVERLLGRGDDVVPQHALRRRPALDLERVSADGGEIRRLVAARDRVEEELGHFGSTRHDVRREPDAELGVPLVDNDGRAHVRRRRVQIDNDVIGRGPLGSQQRVDLERAPRLDRRRRTRTGRGGLELGDGELPIEVLVDEPPVGFVRFGIRDERRDGEPREARRELGAPCLESPHDEHAGILVAVRAADDGDAEHPAGEFGGDAAAEARGERAAERSEGERPRERRR
mmetsp:Transcript_17829/g.71499  ORF Transcript_17829/g.71499 Transcript_17829/m.71499 type:complete len:388 (-) Transcript_17829:11-1174(-)